MKRIAGLHSHDRMFTRPHSRGSRGLLLALTLAVSPVESAPAQASIDARVKHLNALLAEHPKMFEIVGFATTTIFVRGRDVLFRYEYSFLAGEPPQRDAATLADLTGELTTTVNPRLKCRVGPPFVDERGSDCLTRQLRAADGANVTFELEDPAAEFLIMAVEDLMAMLKAREEALR